MRKGPVSEGRSLHLEGGPGKRRELVGAGRGLNRQGLVPVASLLLGSAGWTHVFPPAFPPLRVT